MKINKLYCMDCREGLALLEDNSIDCCISSPPYWSLRDYGIEPTIWDGDPNCDHDINLAKFVNWDIKERKIPEIDFSFWQTGGIKRSIGTGKIYEGFCSKFGAWKGTLGLEPDFDLYIKHLCDIYDLVWKVLKPTGTNWVNLGDCYGSAKVDIYGEGNAFKGRTIVDRKDLRPSRKAVKGFQKCLLMIPQRFAIEMINHGWILRNVIIWHKPNPMPSSAKDRFTVDFEYVYFFVKNKKYWFEQQKEPLSDNSATQERYKYKVGNQEHRKDTNVSLVKPGKAFSQYFPKNLEKVRGYKTKPNIENNPQHHGQDIFTYIGGRNKRCVWTIPTKPTPEAHFAVFPPTLVKPMIKAGCPKRGIVLDPFAGIGTTLYTAWKLGRNFIGFEISKEYCEIAEKKYLSKTRYKRLHEFLFPEKEEKIVEN